MISRSILIGLLSLTAAAQDPPSALNMDAILARMAQARAQNHASLKPYTVTRLYVLVGKDEHNQKSEVTAEVRFVPPNVKTYVIKQTEGSGLGERIVRRMLDGETDIVKDYGSTDYTVANYGFALEREELLDGHRCYVIALTPKRKDKTLLRGNLWVDADTFRVRRMEAEPAKSPSWWLKDPHVIFTYGTVDGMWLQTASEFTTSVRIFGRHTMTSHDVKYEAGELAAPRTSPTALE